MFAVYDKNTKKFLYSTSTEPVKERLNEETDEPERVCTLPEDRGYVEWTPPAASLEVKGYVYDDETQAMQPVLRSADEIASIRARQAEATLKAEKHKEILEIKKTLEKYKEDVEQVELFGMERTDYVEKKELCKNMILELRELESDLKTNKLE